MRESFIVKTQSDLDCSQRTKNWPGPIAALAGVRWGIASFLMRHNIESRLQSALIGL